MSRFTYKGVIVSVYKEGEKTYNVQTNFKGEELFGQDNLFKAKNMKQAENIVKKEIDKLKRNR